jgi:hypothetical protein
MHLTALTAHARRTSPSSAGIFCRWFTGHVRVRERAVTGETTRRDFRGGTANFLEMRSIAFHNPTIRIGGRRVGGTPFLVPPRASVPGVAAEWRGAARDWQHFGRTVRESNDRDGSRKFAEWEVRRAGCNQLNGLGVVQPDRVRGELAQCECR